MSLSKRVSIPVSVMQSFRDDQLNVPYENLGAKFLAASNTKEPKITLDILTAFELWDSGIGFGGKLAQSAVEQCELLLTQHGPEVYAAAADDSNLKGLVEAFEERSHEDADLVQTGFSEDGIPVYDFTEAAAKEFFENSVLIDPRPLRSHNTSSGPLGKRTAPKLSAVQKSQNHAIAADLNTRVRVADKRGVANRSVLVSDDRGQYHATKGWRMRSRAVT
jgi:hypothetical protein